MSEFSIPDGTSLNDLPPEEPLNEVHHLQINHVQAVNAPAPAVRFEDAELDLSKEISKPQVCLNVMGEPFGTLGNFSLLIGKAKSRKTFLVSWIMAQAIAQNNIASRNRIVFVDTEQAAYSCQQVGRRVLNMAHPDDPAPDKVPFHIYSLRKYNTTERLEIIEQIINHYDDLCILVIDGIRDLVTSINDEEQATNIATRLLRWTEERNIHILTVLHQNKGDFNARGHLGTELVNKAETTASVAKDTNNALLSKVDAEYTRYKEFSSFAFSINEDGLPEIQTEWSETKESSPREKLAPHEVGDHLHTRVLQTVRRNADKPAYNELVKQVKLAICEHVEKVGDNKAKDYVLHYQNKGFIEKQGKDRSVNSHYVINPFGGF